MQSQKDKVKYAIHKINKKDNEIIKAWINKELEFHSQNQELKEDKTSRNLAITTAGFAILNVILKQPAITGLVILAGLGISVIEAHKQYNISKEQTFKEAIFNYDELKKYEENNPEKDKITENKTLKGISKRKILKRLNKERK